MQAIHFKKDEISLVFLGNPCLKVYRFGCIPFVSDTRHVFGYEIVKDQPKEDSKCVYLEIEKHKKTGILHDKKPVFDPDTHSYKRKGMTLFVETVFHDGFDLEIPENRLLALRATKWKKSGKLPDFLLSKITCSCTAPLLHLQIPIEFMLA